MERIWIRKEHAERLKKKHERINRKLKEETGKEISFTDFLDAKFSLEEAIMDNWDERMIETRLMPLRKGRKRIELKPINLF